MGVRRGSGGREAVWAGSFLLGGAAEGVEGKETKGIEIDE